MVRFASQSQSEVLCNLDLIWAEQPCHGGLYGHIGSIFFICHKPTCTEPYLSRFGHFCDSLTVSRSVCGVDDCLIGFAWVAWSGLAWAGYVMVANRKYETSCASEGCGARAQTSPIDQQWDCW